MEKATRGFSTQLQDGLEALRASLAALDKQEDAASSLRRVARSISRTAEEYGLDSILKWAQLVERADSGSDLISGVQGLIASLEDIQAPESAAVANILIVDDDRTFCFLLRSVLQAPGREILTVGSAADATDLLGRQPFDLLLLDLMLPDADGRDFLLRVREDPAFAGMLIVVVSGIRARQAKAECLALGADDYLEKPVEPEVARTVAARHLAGVWERKGGTSADPETGVTDRAAFFRVLEAQRGKDPRGETPLSMGRLGLHGLSEGAEEEGQGLLLSEFCHRLSGVLGSAALLAAGTDGEVLVLFAGRGPEEATDLLTRAQLGLARPTATDSGGAPREAMRFSGGVVDVSGKRGLREGMAEVDRLLRRATSGRPPQILAEDQGTGGLDQRILLVEDDRVTAALIKHRLERDGFAVVHHEDGQAAYEAVVEDEGLALAIVDVKLPGMDGFELLQRMRELRHLANLPVIMLTSMGRETDIVRGFELGADDYMLKPFSAVELLARIHRSLRA